MRTWLAKRWWVLLIAFVGLSMLQPSLRLLTQRLDDRLAAHARQVLGSATLPAPTGTRYAPLPWAGDAVKSAMMPRGPMLGGGGGYGHRGLVEGLVSYDGHWHGRLIPTAPPADDAAFTKLCAEVRDTYVQLLTVKGADTRSSEDPLCALWLGSVQYPAEHRPDVRQFVNVQVFGNPDASTITVSIDLTGGAAGLSSCFSARSLL